MISLLLQKMTVPCAILQEVIYDELRCEKCQSMFDFLQLIISFV